MRLGQRAGGMSGRGRGTEECEASARHLCAGGLPYSGRIRFPRFWGRTVIGNGVESDGGRSLALKPDVFSSGAGSQVISAATLQGGWDFLPANAHAVLRRLPHAKAAFPLPSDQGRWAAWAPSRRNLPFLCHFTHAHIQPMHKGRGAIKTPLPQHGNGAEEKENSKERCGSIPVCRKACLPSV